ncbi:DUF1622 domain-containing protein [Edaphosphingomonas haloaromaticamans]|uniref:DUF1622 domain-containing protein n=1 Tax=Edaphosphingomonas haloaromaticamans TaxID=653954 RepID=A0A1S1HER9_9SPHN|nr:DUF1622 domain-containing protein [Sphingomonas haloaromaticamans]OHT20598.1 hypothetical protein BHE75_02597 [Sphingomonas haloaromaticamans]
MIEEWLIELTALVVPLIELAALIVITIGTAEAFVRGVPAMLSGRKNGHAVRLIWMRQARWLIAGLTFQLAADIIETSTAPSWDDVGRLGAIAVIRTFLNVFLERDQREIREIEERRALDSGKSPRPGADPTTSPELRTPSSNGDRP